jgi:hypothetical protein
LPFGRHVGDGQLERGADHGNNNVWRFCTGVLLAASTTTSTTSATTSTTAAAEPVSATPGFTGWSPT